MTYTVDRLPKDIAIAVSVGFLGAVLGGAITYMEATRAFVREYPHDGQDVLGGLYFGLLAMPVFGLLSAVPTFIARYLSFRKAARLEEDREFLADLHRSRKSD